MINIVRSAIIASLSLSAAALATPPASKTCVPLRDKAGQPTGAQACRTQAEWRKILSRAVRDQSPAQRYPTRLFNTNAG